jgi:hypothetical protein
MPELPEMQESIGSSARILHAIADHQEDREQFVNMALSLSRERMIFINRGLNLLFENKTALIEAGILRELSEVFHELIEVETQTIEAWQGEQKLLLELNRKARQECELLENERKEKE